MTPFEFENAGLAESSIIVHDGVAITRAQLAIFLDKLNISIDNARISDIANDLKRANRVKNSKFVFLDISISGAAPERLEIELFSGACPKTVSRFIEMMGTRAVNGNLVSYKMAQFSRLVLNGWIELGHVGESHDTFADENFIIEHKIGTLSMVNSGPNSNDNKFMILLKDMPYFDKKYVAFGRIYNGYSCFQKMKNVKVRGEQIMESVQIIGCGLAPQNGQPDSNDSNPSQ